MTTPNIPEIVFWQRTEKRGPEECWTWRGQTLRNGYGVVWIRGKLRKATHVSLELHGKPRPGRDLALHSCDNPICVNPSHLRWGTYQDNANDKVVRGRCYNGDRSKHPNFKATPALIAKVLASAESGRELSRRLNVSTPVINRIRRNAGLSRKVGRVPTMRMRVFEHMRSFMDTAGLVHVSQTAIAKAIGLAPSNVNLSIEWLVETGRLKRVSQDKSRIWTYRVT